MFNMIPYRTNRAMAAHDNYDLFRSFFGNDFANAMFQGERMMKVDVRDDGDHYTMEADVPGFSKDDVKVSVENNILTIAAESSKEEKKEEEGKVIYAERHFGRTSRSFNLEGIDETGITARYEDGVLKLALPKKAEEIPAAREIAIA